MDQTNVLACAPIAGFVLIQIIKFIKLSVIHEVLLALCISVPYMFYLRPRNVREIGTQTNMDFEETEEIHRKDIFELVKYFLLKLFGRLIKK